MSLVVYNNRTSNTHENEQFRRVVSIISEAFEKYHYEGILIGNPFNEMYPRFRADAILVYTNGVVLIDFKDYQGVISLPLDEQDFKRNYWYNESSNDKKRIIIKAGSRFINPFLQLVSYRNAFREIIETNKSLQLNSSRVCVVNIFSGPITVENEVPRNIPYYKILQESNIDSFLYDYAGEDLTDVNTIKDNLRRIFPAKTWGSKDVEISTTTESPTVVSYDNCMEEEEKNIIDTFLNSKANKILLLASNDIQKRNKWFFYIRDNHIQFQISQVEPLCHSNRIAKKIEESYGIISQSIYSIIYSGIAYSNELTDDTEDEKEEDDTREIVPIASSSNFDENTLFIVNEAHLIGNSFSQSELLRFGTGRLLQDLLKFVFDSTQSINRKLVFIGDPYSLSYGGEKDCVMNLDCLKELTTEKIIFYKSIEKNDNTTMKNLLKSSLGDSIEQNVYNKLFYNYDQESLSLLEKDFVTQKLQNWFSAPLEEKPKNAVLFYRKTDCLKTNQWIKKQCLCNGENLSQGDLLILNNNIIIPDKTGFSQPTRMYNGMYVRVVDIGKSINEEILLRNSISITLTFVELRVKCLSINGYPEVTLYMLKNFFDAEDNLSKNEMIAFRIFVNRKVKEYINKNGKFVDSEVYKMIFNSPEYKDFTQTKLPLEDGLEDTIKILAENYDLPKEKKRKIKTTEDVRRLVSKYYRIYYSGRFSEVRESDPFVNAAYFKYGWAITVHKSIGCSFNNIILKATQNENSGISNESYFRWLYTAVNEAENTVYINHPQQINPFMDMNIVDNATIIPQIDCQKKLLIYDDSEITYDKDFFHDIDNRNVLECTWRLSSLLKKEKYDLKDLLKSSDYLYKVKFVSFENGSSVVLNIDVKGPKDKCAISRIRTENIGFLDENKFNNYRQELFEIKMKVFHDFRDDIYEIIVDKMKEYSINIGISESNPWQDVFIANDGSDQLKYRLYYNSIGFITRIEILEKTSENIGQQVLNILQSLKNNC